MTETIRVSFNRPIALFPFPDLVLLPHETLPLHIFEARYRDMVSQCLDRSGQFAIATWLSGPRRQHRRGETVADPVPLRPAVCVSQIQHHQELPDGRFNLLMQGVARARIRELFEPAGDRPFRLARLEPLESYDDPPSPMTATRNRLRTLLNDPTLDALTASTKLREWVDSATIPTRALLEFISFATVSDTDRKYDLLSEANPRRRAGLLELELRHLAELVTRTADQSFPRLAEGHELELRSPARPVGFPL